MFGALSLDIPVVALVYGCFRWTLLKLSTAIYALYPTVAASHTDVYVLQKDSRWSDDGITEQGFDTVSRVLTIYIIKLAPLAIVQPRFLDFPYKSWSLEPVGSHIAVLTLHTPRFIVKIEVCVVSLDRNIARTMCWEYLQHTRLTI